MPTVVPLLIARNLVSGSARDGFRIGYYPSKRPGPVLDTLRDNVALDDVGHGINVVFPGEAVDDGHNQASGNALDPQCIGVAC